MKKQTQKNLGIASIIILVIVGAYLGFRPLAIGIVGIPTPQFQTDSWKGNILETESQIFGSVNSATNEFCNDNDGAMSMSNSITIGDRLTLSSSASGSKNICGINYIQSKISLPKGKLKAKCSVSSSATSGSGTSYGLCDVNGNKLETQACDSASAGCSKPTGGSDLNCMVWSEVPCSNSKTFEIEILEPKTITASLKTTNSAGGNSDTSLVLEFTPFQEPRIDIYRFENNECTLRNIQISDRQANDYDTLVECESKIQQEEISVYRFESNDCTLITIPKIEKQANDFDSLEECEQNIEVSETTNIILVVITLIIVGGLVGLYLWIRK